jgi:chemotaxis regulatin CheY-phosphate phosphatase CheZ
MKAVSSNYSWKQSFNTNVHTMKELKPPPQIESNKLEVISKFSTRVDVLVKSMGFQTWMY